jgi:hypothetical protein
MNSHLINFIGKIVLFRVSPSFLEESRSLLQPHKEARSLYAKLVAVDTVGCWVENHSWQTINDKTKEKTQHNIHIFIPWNSLISIAAFPDRVFNEIPDETDVHGIGFLARV